MQVKLKEFFYLSNLMSLARIILIWPMVYLVKIDTHEGNYLLIAVAVVAILTDYFDGYFSRRFKQVTDLGKVLDPIADKLIMAVVMVALIYYRNFPLDIVAWLVYRDLMILVFGIIIASREKAPRQSNVWGKWNTFIFSLMVLVFLIAGFNIVFTVLYYASYAILAISGISYYLVGEKVLFPRKVTRFLFRLFIFIFTVFIGYVIYLADHILVPI